ncbi:ferrous iron transport protein B [Streptococcus sp. zg-JUN1979]|uniref:ferrous iron transport protein B n=1 Tax=Streptococcus sp. zg-JUN1979 TaxID=3391450 RepID=UPI0039A507F9
MTEIALIGNPNSGKTTLFNRLTGSNQHVGNWPGVTVERKSGKIKGHKDLLLQDLPGIYSMSPYTPEETVARDYLLSNRASIIVNVVDSTNLERNLYLTTQLIEMGLPVLLALNMTDILKNKQKQISADKLSYQLGVSVVEMSARSGLGVTKALKEVNSLLKHPKKALMPTYDDKLEAALAEIIEVLGDSVPSRFKRFYAIKLFERDSLVAKELDLSVFQRREIDDIIAITEEIFTEESEAIVINERYAFIERVCQMAMHEQDDFSLSNSDKIDQIVTNRFLALPIFALVMFLVYYLSIQTVGTLATDWVNDVLFGEYVPHLATTFLEKLKVDMWLQSLIVDGIIAGVGAVLGFLPQIFVLFWCLGILEDIGYMSRIAFIMDRLFRRFGLSGKSFIPMLISTGCGVPGIMASRTIESERERKITIMTTTFMPCSAKLSIIALIAGAFFPGNAFVAPSSYFLGMLAIILSGIGMKKTRLLGGYTSPFVMELPAYHLPKLGAVCRYAYLKALSFAKRAGTIIFSLTIIIWFTSSYNMAFEQVETDKSILADLGRLLAGVFSPLGFGNWRATVAAISGLVAKETVVATFGILYHQPDADEMSRQLWSSLQADYSPLAAYSFMTFNLLCAPCFAAIGAIKREMNAISWTVGAILFQTGLAYVVSLLVYQFGLVLIYHSPIRFWTIIAMCLTVILLYLIVRKPNDKDLVISLDNLALIEK